MTRKTNIAASSAVVEVAAQVYARRPIIADRLALIARCLAVSLDAVLTRRANIATFPTVVLVGLLVYTSLVADFLTRRTLTISVHAGLIGEADGAALSTMVLIGLGVYAFSIAVYQAACTHAPSACAESIRRTDIVARTAVLVIMSSVHTGSATKGAILANFWGWGWS